MKKALLLLLVLTGSVYASAQTGKYGKFDFEFGFEIPLLAERLSGAKNKMVPFFHLEGRWQLRSQPIDIGFHIGMSAVVRKFAEEEESYRTATFMIVGDYQFGRGKKYNPFIGIGAGVSKGFDRDVIVVSPRAGVRCFKFLNLSMGYLITHREYSRLYANLGFYF